MFEFRPDGELSEFVESFDEMKKVTRQDLVDIMEVFFAEKPELDQKLFEFNVTECGLCMTVRTIIGATRRL